MFLSTTYNSRLVMIKNIKQIPLMEYPPVHLTSVSRKCQGRQEQGKSEELSQTNKPKKK